ncbi:MAG: hypothetical protein ACRC0L_01660 [Angustibacter sp.]
MSGEMLRVNYPILKDVQLNFVSLKSDAEAWQEELPNWLERLREGLGEFAPDAADSIDSFVGSWKAGCAAVAMTAGIIAANADNFGLELAEVDVDISLVYSILPGGGGSR